MAEWLGIDLTSAGRETPPPLQQKRIVLRGQIPKMLILVSTGGSGRNILCYTSHCLGLLHCFSNVITKKQSGWLCCVTTCHFIHLIDREFQGLFVTVKKLFANKTKEGNSINLLGDHRLAIKGRFGFPVLQNII